MPHGLHQTVFCALISPRFGERLHTHRPGLAAIEGQGGLLIKKFQPLVNARFPIDAARESLLQTPVRIRMTRPLVTSRRISFTPDAAHVLLMPPIVSGKTDLDLESRGRLQQSCRRDPG